MSVSRKKTYLICLVALFVSASCTHKLAHKDSEPEGPAAAVQTKSYPAVGKVTGLDPKLPTIEIDHDHDKRETQTRWRPKLFLFIHRKNLLLDPQAPRLPDYDLVTKVTTYKLHKHYYLLLLTKPE